MTPTANIDELQAFAGTCIMDLSIEELELLVNEFLKSKNAT